ncbi:MAG: DUF2723 domain-containing protein [candidate division WOR-3 bacterium]
MKKFDYLLGLLLFIIVFSVYLYTVTPTLPFWDCGEFISCSYSLGVPHPPGTPLMILLGNMIIRILFFVKEVALRVNLFSSISSALASVFLFFIILKVFRRVETFKDEKWNYISAFFSSLFASLIYSFWQSAIEAEVYNPAVLMILISIFLCLVWWDKLDDKNDDRYVMLVIYITLLSIGIHMLSLLALPAALIFFIVVAWRKYYDLSVSLISFGVLFSFLYLAVTKENMVLLIVGLFLSVITVVMIDSFNSQRKVNYKKVFSYLGIYTFLILVAVSTYAVLIIRAKQNPYINIAAPVTLRDLWDVFNRKQYGPMNLLPRKTDYGIGTIPAYIEQIKVFIRYYSWQFSPIYRPEEVLNPSVLLKILSSLIVSITSIIGFYGIYVHYKKEKKTFILIGIVLLLLSFGLITYLNLKYSPSDPNPLHVEKEVRERDYFYAPSYFLFFFFFAFGIREFFERAKNNKNSMNFISIFLIIFLVIISISPIFANIRSNANRRNNWIADEYAKNMLDTPRDNAVIFTNGDNDTYPLWFEQVVRNYRTLDRKNRKGVMVCNLSLLNTPWYIKQMKSFGVPISFTDEEIDNLMPVRLPNGEVLYVRDLAIRNMMCTTSGIKCTKDILYSSTQEFKTKVLDNYKADSIEIYFSVTVSDDARMGYKQNSVLEGLAYRIVSTEEAKKYPYLIDVERTKHNIYNVYKYKYILDEKIVKDDNIDRIMTNYAAGFLQLGIYYAQIDSLEKSIEYLREGRKFYVYDRNAVTLQITRFLMDLGKYEEAEREILYGKSIDKKGEKTEIFDFLLGQIYLKLNDYQKSLEIFKKYVDKDPKNAMFLSGLLKVYYKQGDSVNFESIVQNLKTDLQLLGNVIGFFYMEKEEPEILTRLLDLWDIIKPGDEQIQQIREEVKMWVKRKGHKTLGDDKNDKDLKEESVETLISQ